MTNKHTPTPWRFVWNPQGKEALILANIGSDDRPYEAIIATVRRSFASMAVGEGMDNGEHIIRAVNAHDALASLAQSVIFVAKYSDLGKEHLVQELEKLAREALKLAKGENL